MDIDRTGYSSLNDYAYQHLKKMIISGELKPDTEITETSAAEMLSISRTPVKSALYRLAGDGLIEIRPNKGYFVRKYELTEINEILQAREVLEGLIASVACSKMTPEDIEYLGSLFPPKGTPYDPAKKEEYYENGQRLHSFIRAKANNRVVNMLLQMYGAMIKCSAVMSTEVPKRFEDAYNEHIDIITAIKQNNPKTAEAKMRKHIYNTRTSLLKKILT